MFLLFSQTDSSSSQHVALKECLCKKKKVIWVLSTPQSVHFISQELKVLQIIWVFQILLCTSTCFDFVIFVWDAIATLTSHKLLWSESLSLFFVSVSMTHSHKRMYRTRDWGLCPCHPDNQEFFKGSSGIMGGSQIQVSCIAFSHPSPLAWILSLILTVLLVVSSIRR